MSPPGKARRCARCAAKRKETRGIMGLDIYSKSHHEYHASYGGIHYIRWHAYRFCGGEKKYSDWMADHHEGKSYDWCEIVAAVTFPNLLLHSDCDGTYTRNGRVDAMNGDLLTGNSVQLLRELRRLKPFMEACKCSVRHDTFEMLLPLVEDVVTNHDGRIEFR